MAAIPGGAGASFSWAVRDPVQPFSYVKSSPLPLAGEGQLRAAKQGEGPAFDLRQDKAKKPNPLPALRATLSRKRERERCIQRFAGAAADFRFTRVYFIT
jgi:hypothetical protein